MGQLGHSLYLMNDEMPFAGSNDDRCYIDNVCAICDDGGDIVSCTGKCLRSFHAFRDSNMNCSSLGLTRGQLEEITNFLCQNCKFEIHQCYACGSLGSSNIEARPQVFKCVSESCGHFYHANCLAELFHPQNRAAALNFAGKIAKGEKFECPAHRCAVCKQPEDEDEYGLHLGVCRRCPTSYHRICLPRNIAFESSSEFGLRRAWDGFLPKNRILIYCLKHSIDESFETPLRNHLKFPNDDWMKNNLESNPKVNKLRIKIPSYFSRMPACDFEKNERKKEIYSEEISNKRKTAPTSLEKVSHSMFPEVNGSTETNICNFLNGMPSVSLEDISKNLFTASTYQCPGRDVEKLVPEGILQRYVNNLRNALWILDNGGSIFEAQSICSRADLIQVLRYKSKLNVYLGPFLHGMRYTSYGRHFTKLTIIREIVDKLQYYVQDGDMVVDFCCGANDFSISMKEKLEAAGKNCLFKNYDLICPKNDFCFEKRDWMTVQPEELLPGSQLVMGLNPPFGVKASLANQFINKALSFNPKLIILIVPKETKRLDARKSPYDLIWEDSKMLSGKSFYLPGSVDTNNKTMEDWNLKPPPLSLWSRRDWTVRHMDIARDNGHVAEDDTRYSNRAMVPQTCLQEATGFMEETQDDIEIGGWPVEYFLPEDSLHSGNDDVPAVSNSPSDMELDSPQFEPAGALFKKIFIDDEMASDGEAKIHSVAPDGQLSECPPQDSSHFDLPFLNSLWEDTYCDRNAGYGNERDDHRESCYEPSVAAEPWAKQDAAGWLESEAAAPNSCIPRTPEHNAAPNSPKSAGSFLSLGLFSADEHKPAPAGHRPPLLPNPAPPTSWGFVPLSHVAPTDAGGGWWPPPS